MTATASPVRMLPAAPMRFGVWRALPVSRRSRQASVNEAWQAEWRLPRVLPMDDVVSRYYVRLTVEDRPGVFAKIAGILAKAKIGISSIIQPEGHDGATVPVILMIHDAPNAAMSKALKQIARLGVVKGEPAMFRVESFE